MNLRVLSVASEAYPLVKTGGLADVVGALPAALAAERIEVRTLLPGYPAVAQAIEGGRRVLRYADLFGGRAAIVHGRAAGLDLYMLEAPHLFDRTGNPYLGADGLDWTDNALRFAALARAAADIAGGALKRWTPAVLHAHDWQAALAPAYLHYAGGARPGTVLTVHNLAFQGRFPAALLARLGLPATAMGVDGVEYWGDIGFLKAGLRFADRITTVSPTYAAEIATPEGGMGLDGLLRGRGDVVSGILNGIDTDVWNPATDQLIAARFDAASLPARTANRAALQERFALDRDAVAPLFGVVSRLSDQKGLDLLARALPTIVQAGAQLALIGTGDAALEAAFRAAAAQHPGRIGVLIGYDEPAAHLLQAGIDVLLVPSRFEPCGLTQLCALRYGAIPVVARVGGLADTVIDANPVALAAGVATGVQFAGPTLSALENAIRHTVTLHASPDVWRTMQTNAMATDVSWAASAKRYAALYRAIAVSTSADSPSPLR